LHSIDELLKLMKTWKTYM